MKKTAKERCVSKYEKKLAKAIERNEKYGKYWWDDSAKLAAIYEEVIKDLKRID